MARRPQQLPPRTPLASTQIPIAAYVGSAEHKAKRWWGGLPQAYVGPSGAATRPKKQKTTVCPLVNVADRALATQWVRAALSAGQYRYLEADQDFPSRIWYREGETGQLWIGYCINSTQGQYKGWPVEEEDHIAVFGSVARSCR